MSSPAYVSEPQIQYLSQLLGEIADGHIQVPRFQRPFLWTDEQRFDLLRSIRSGTPIGSILVWRTSRQDLRVFEWLGPHRLAKPDRTAGDRISYLLDGHQRLSTLFGAFQPRRQVEQAGSYPESSDIRWDLYYDLEEDQFTFKNEKGSALLPLWKVLDSVELMRFQRGLADRSNADQLIRATEELVSAVRGYKIPVIPIVTEDLDRAAMTFQRINSQGTPMSHVHMVAALTWTREFDLRERLREIQEGDLADLGWGELADKYILTACKAAYDLDIYETDADAVSRKIRDHPEVLDATAQCLVRAARFLKERCGIGSPRPLPYSHQIVLLAEALRVNPEPEPEIADRLEHWFWWSSYIGLSSNLNSSRLRQAMRDVRALARGSSSGNLFDPATDLEPVPQRFDFRLARAKTLALRLAARQNQASDNTEASILLAERGAEALQHLLSYALLRKSHSATERLISSPANRVLVAPERANRLRSHLLRPTKRRPDELFYAHVIPERAAEALATQDYERFIEYRLEALNNLERRFLVGQGLLSSLQAVSVPRGGLLWRKMDLPPSDVQRQVKGNPTGGLRLTQAGWRIDGKVIDQTKYFRHTVFGGLEWRVGKDQPFREDASARFHITLLGRFFGIHVLQLSHKPSGEAGQGNYTTILHWGPSLAEIIQSLDLIGKTLSLYAPPAGNPAPFFLEIS